MRHFVARDCGLQLVLEWHPDDDGLYVHVHLTNYKNVFQRLWHAVKYVFGHKSKYGCFDEVVLSIGEADRMADFIEGFVAHHKRLPTRESLKEQLDLMRTALHGERMSHYCVECWNESLAKGKLRPVIRVCSACGKGMTSVSNKQV